MDLNSLLDHKYSYWCGVLFAPLFFSCEGEEIPAKQLPLDAGDDEPIDAELHESAWGMG